jgi:cytochrome c-type biogenesis protein CcmH
LALAPGAPASASGMISALAVVCIALLPVAALLIYAQLGSPGTPDLPFAARAEPGGTAVAATGSPHLDMAEAVARLAAHLKQSPDDLTGWQLLGRSQLDLGHFQDAADAFRHAADLSGQRADILGDYGEALVLSAGGTVTDAARQAFEKGLKDPETAPRAHYYLALAAYQHGDAKAALQQWVDLEADAPADADWLPLLRRRIAEAAGASGIDQTTLKTSSGAPRTVPAPTTPSPEASAPRTAAPSDMPPPQAVAEAAKGLASASPDQRKAMIEGMVARLAARLAEQPDDGDGWVRLGRSYTVLGQPDKARDAYARAVKLLPDQVELKIAYADAMVAAAGDAAEPPAEVGMLMREVLQAEPENQEALWYVGLAEADAGHRRQAYDLWSKLLAQLPADAPERKELEQRLAALKVDAK